MDVVVHINRCQDCRHLDHSGGHTEDEAKMICGHKGAVPSRKSVGDDNFHWKYRVLKEYKKGIIPDWCPLRRGCKY